MSATVSPLIFRTNLPASERAGESSCLHAVAKNQDHYFIIHTLRAEEIETELSHLAVEVPLPGSVRPRFEVLQSNSGKWLQFQDFSWTSISRQQALAVAKELEIRPEGFWED